MKNSKKDNNILEYFDYLNLNFHNGIWLTLLNLRKKMIAENLSLADVSKAVESGEIQGINKYSLSNLRSLSIYYALFSVVAFKEQYEALLDLDMISKDEEQQKFLSKFPNMSGCLELLSFLRNNTSHAGLKISTFGDTILIKDMQIHLNDLKDYLDSVMATLLKSFKAYKHTMAPEMTRKNLHFVPFSAQKTLFESLIKPEDGEEFPFTKIDSKNNKFMDKLLIIMTSEKLNEIMLTNPTMKWSEIKKEILGFIGQYKGYPNFNEIINIFKSDKQIIDIDAILYAQFVLSSKLYDLEYDYNGKIENISSYSDINQTIDYLRNSIIHGMFELGDSGEILCSGLNSQGYSKLKDVRKLRRKLNEKDLQIILRNNPIFADENVEDKIAVSSDELTYICKNIARIYENEKDYPKLLE